MWRQSPEWEELPGRRSRLEQGTLMLAESEKVMDLSHGPTLWLLNTWQVDCCAYFLGWRRARVRWASQLPVLLLKGLKSISPAGTPGHD